MKGGFLFTAGKESAMETALWIFIWIFIGLWIATIVALVLIYRHGLKSSGMLRSQVTELERQLSDTQGKKDEFVALDRQVEELRALKTNLENQVQGFSDILHQSETASAVAQAQIDSANTQFTDLQEKIKVATARLAEVEAIVTKRCHNVDEQVEEHRKKVEAEGQVKLEQELLSQRQAATEALLKQLEELRAQVDASELVVREKAEEQATLTELVAKLRLEADQMAKSHAEALKRLAMDAGTGGQIHLEQADREEVALIRKMCKGLRCENAVLKATYDVYVKPEIERVVKEAGVSGVSGIYRIWRKDGERELSYIGQAVDVGERWKTHAKRAWGVDNTGRIVLYQAMMSSGIEEWCWELVEECDVAVLSEREKYWGEFYAVKELGLNKKLG